MTVWWDTPKCFAILRPVISFCRWDTSSNSWLLHSLTSLPLSLLLPSLPLFLPLSPLSSLFFLPSLPLFLPLSPLSSLFFLPSLPLFLPSLPLLPSLPSSSSFPPFLSSLSLPSSSLFLSLPLLSSFSSFLLFPLSLPLLSSSSPLIPSLSPSHKQAAAHIHRYLTLDENILLETTADTSKGINHIASLASFPVPHTLECKHWSYVGVESLVLIIEGNSLYVHVEKTSDW